MLEMKYQKTRIHPPIILNSGIYKKHKFTVLNLGTHPTAYVECKINDIKDYDDEKLWDVTVNGGLTYFGCNYWGNQDSQGNYIGWDYAHAWDWVGYDTEEENKSLGNEKHTTQEMTADCYKVIEQLIEIEEKIM